MITNRCLRIPVYIILTFSFLGCGGSDIEEVLVDDISQTPTHGDTSADNSFDNTDNATQSTQLVEQSVVDNAAFSQFKFHEFNLNLNSLNLNGEHIFLKIYNAENEPLYLGKAPQDGLFTFHLPNDETVIFYEVFTNDPTDPQIKEQVSYK